MIILAADTSTTINTVALCDGDRLVAETIVDCGRKHSERLLATVDWVLREAGVELGALDALAIAIGPGSFTGLRVGVAAWKGLAFAAKRPLVSVPTLDAMTRLSYFRDSAVCPLVDAKMGEVFGAVYRFEGSERERLTPDKVCPVETLLALCPESTIFLGDGATRYRERILAVRQDAAFVPPPCGLPRAGAVAMEAVDLLRCGAPSDAAAAAPVYLRKAQAEELRRKAVP